MKSIKITLMNNQELNTEFMDAFSKVLMGNCDHLFKDHFEQSHHILYSDFYRSLTKETQIKQPLIKYSPNKFGTNYSFSFQSIENNITFLLDLSPYMLIYNYGTTSFPLKNLTDIFKYLIETLIQRKKISKLNSINNITIYLFSIYSNSPHMLLLHENLTQSTMKGTIEFVLDCINRSELPFERTVVKKHLVSEIIQRVLNVEECQVGMKSMIIISSFHEEEPLPVIFFTPQWYIYGFISTGGHMGSFSIQQEELEKKYIMPNYFKTKYFFQAVFMENWQKLDLLQTHKFQIIRPKPESKRTIIFQKDQQYHQDIYNQLLEFKINLKNIRDSKQFSDRDSCMSTYRQDKKITHKDFKVPACHFSYILKTKYIQGWEPISINSSSLVQNSKFKLKLRIDDNNILYYQASRSMDNFQVSIYQSSTSHSHGHHQPQHIKKPVYVLNSKNHEKVELTSIIEKVDRINSSEFENPANKNFLAGKLSRRNSFNMVYHEEEVILDELCTSKDNWGMYFKLKTLSLKFQPYLSKAYFEQFMSEILFFLGKRVTNSIFLKKSESDNFFAQNDKMSDPKTVSSKIMFTKMNAFGNIVEMSFGFLRYSYREVESALELLRNKFSTKKFKLGMINFVPNKIASYYKDPSLTSLYFFNRRWAIKFKSNVFRRFYSAYVEQLLKAKKFEEINLSDHSQHEKHYFKIIQILNEHSRMTEKVIFLKINDLHEKQSEIQYSLGVSPCLLKVLPLKSQNQLKPKLISIPELLNIIQQEIQLEQQCIIRILETYLKAHEVMLRKIRDQNKFRIYQSERLKESVRKIYNFKGNFKDNIISFCEDILANSYRDIELSKKGYSSIPLPAKFLINTEIDDLQCDLTIQIEQNKLYFFLLTPLKLIYLMKKENSFCYKFVSLIDEEMRITENEESIKDDILNEVKEIIKFQEYRRQYKEFYSSLGLKHEKYIIENKDYTNSQEIEIKVDCIFRKLSKINQKTAKTKKILLPRVEAVFKEFADKYFQIIDIFFEREALPYFFQSKNSSFSKETIKYQLNNFVLRQFNEIFIQTLSLAENQHIQITRTTFPDFFLKGNDENKARLVIRFYQNAIFKKQDIKFPHLILYLVETLNKLSEEISLEIERVLIENFDELQKNFRSLDCFHKNKGSELVSLRELIREEGVEKISKHIESESMKKVLNFKRVNTDKDQFIFVQAIQEPIFIPFPLHLIITDLDLEFVFQKRIFFHFEDSGKKILFTKYSKMLINFMNLNILMQELVETLNLPLDPYELYLSESANGRENKIVNIIPKKKTTKGANISKRIGKLLDRKKTSEKEESLQLNVESNKKDILMPAAYRNFIALHERLPSKEGLNAIREYQYFNVALIYNLKDTYLFLKLVGEDHIILHLEQTENLNLIKEISAENQSYDAYLSSLQPSKLSKKYLVYYIHTLRVLSKKEIQDLDAIILTPIKNALDRKTFSCQCKYLLHHYSILEEQDELFLKGIKKNISFEAPIVSVKDTFRGYLAQQLSLTHFKTAYKTQSDKNHDSPHSFPFINSIRAVSTYANNTASGNYSSIGNNSLKQSFFQKEKNIRQADRRSTAYLENSQYFSQYSNASDSIELDQISVAKSFQFQPNLKRSEVFKIESKGQNSEMYLFNCERKKHFIEEFGKCLYLLKIDLSETIKENDQSIRIFEKYSKSNERKLYIYGSQNSQYERNQIKKYLLKKNIGKLLKRESGYKHSIHFNIIECVGVAKFEQIQMQFHHILRSSFCDYFIQNYLQDEVQLTIFSFINEEKWSNILSPQQKPLNFTISEELLGRSLSSPQKTQKVFDKYSIFDVVSAKMLDLGKEINQIISIEENKLFCYHKCETEMLFKDIAIYFIHFLQEFIMLIQKNNKILVKNKASLPILIYCVYLSNYSNKYFKIKTTIADLKKELLEEIGSKDIKRMGFILCDHLDDIYGKIDEKYQKMTFENLQIFHDDYAGNSQTFYFKRSMYVNYQISKQGIYYWSYNVTDYFNKDIEQYLIAIESWLAEKARLLKFIKNIKEFAAYQYSDINHIIQHKSFYSRESKIAMERSSSDDITLSRELKHVLKQEQSFQNQEEITESRLLIDLVFKEFPSRNQEGGLLNIGDRCDKLYKLLMENQVDYKKYPEYKGKEKFALERLGRQYLTLIRLEYGFTVKGKSQGQ